MLPYSNRKLPSWNILLKDILDQLIPFVRRSMLVNKYRTIERYLIVDLPSVLFSFLASSSLVFLVLVFLLHKTHLRIFPVASSDASYDLFLEHLLQCWKDLVSRKLQTWAQLMSF